MSDQIDKTEKSQNGKQQAERESYSKNRDAHYQRNERTAAQNTGSQQEKKTDTVSDKPSSNRSIESRAGKVNNGRARGGNYNGYRNRSHYDRTVGEGYKGNKPSSDTSFAKDVSAEHKSAPAEAKAAQPGKMQGEKNQNGRPQNNSGEYRERKTNTVIKSAVSGAAAPDGAGKCRDRRS